MTIGLVPNGIKVEMNYVQNGIPVVNRFFVTLEDPPETGDLENAIDATHNFYNDIKIYQHPTLMLANITVTDVDVANGAQIIQPYTTDNVGTGAGAAAAANAAMCVSLRTGVIGRSYRGRFYLGGIAALNMFDAQTWYDTTVADVADIFSTFIESLNTLGLKLVVVSNYLNNALRAIAVATEIISIIVDNKVDSQRRRTAN